MGLQEWLQLLVSVGTLFGMIFIIYKSLSDPDIKAANRIDLLTQGCDLRHKSLEELWGEKFSNMEQNISSINKTFILLQENDLKHIENSVSLLETGQTKIFTILDERLPKKNN